MTITTHPRIWAHKELLPLVHEGNRHLEEEAAEKAATMSVAWGLDESETRTLLSVVVVQSACAGTPLTLEEVTDVEHLLTAFRAWCKG